MLKFMQILFSLLLATCLRQLPHKFRNIPFFWMLPQSWKRMIQPQIVFFGCSSLKLDHMHLLLVPHVDIEPNYRDKYHRHVFLPTRFWKLSLLIQWQITHDYQRVPFQLLPLLEDWARFGNNCHALDIRIHLEQICTHRFGPRPANVLGSVEKGRGKVR